jgi:hypothetical protein
MRGVTRHEYERQQWEIDRVLGSCTSPILTVIGPGDQWFDDDGYSLKADSEKAYYVDGDHVSSYGAEKLIRPLLKPVFDTMRIEPVSE